MTSLPAPIVEPEQSGRLEPLRPLETAAVAQAMAAYQEGLASILVDSDYQTFVDKDGEKKSFPKKSAWRKIGLWFGLDLQLMEQTVERDEHGLPLRAYVVYRAKAPNGRFADGDGRCSKHERRFSKPENDIPGTAATRALNRAVSNLVGLGQTSAEELDGSVEPGIEPPAWTQPASVERIEALHGYLADTGLDEAHVQGLITAWATAYQSIPDLIVQVARGLAGAVHHQQQHASCEVIDDAQVVDLEHPQA